MTSKPKKNTRKEIRGWACVDSSNLTIGMAFDDEIFAIYPTKVKAWASATANEIVKPCRIILD